MRSPKPEPGPGPGTGTGHGPAHGPASARPRAGAPATPKKRSGAGPPLLAAGFLLAACCSSGNSQCTPVSFTGIPGTTAASATECTNSDKPLLRAAATGDTQSVQRLLDRGEDINQVNADGRTALLCAAMEDKPATASQLISRGADVKLANAAGDTPLLWAAHRADPMLTETLLAAGADPNASANSGHSPLLRAALAGPTPGATDAAIRLLSAGADPNKVGFVSGSDACAVNRAVHNTGLHPPPGPTTTASASDTAAYVAWLNGTTTSLPGTEIPDCPNTTPPFLPVTALANASFWSNNELMAALLDHGADPDALTVGRYSPLYISALVGNDEGVKILLAHGADPELTGPPPTARPADAACTGAHVTTARLLGEAVLAKRGLPGPLGKPCPPPR